MGINPISGFKPQTSVTDYLREILEEIRELKMKLDSADNIQATKAAEEGKAKKQPGRPKKTQA